MHQDMYTILTILFADFIDPANIDARFLFLRLQPFRFFGQELGGREAKRLFGPIKRMGFC